MVSFAAMRSAASCRIFTPVVARYTQKRGMALGGHHGPPPDWQGVDKIVRSYFPEDYKLAAAILGGYTGLFVFYKLVSAVSGGKKKAPEPIKVVEVPSSTTGIPDIESPAFEKFVESDAFMKLLENEEQLKGLIEK